MIVIRHNQDSSPSNKRDINFMPKHLRQTRSSLSNYCNNTSTEDPRVDVCDRKDDNDENIGAVVDARETSGDYKD